MVEGGPKQGQDAQRGSPLLLLGLLFCLLYLLTDAAIEAYILRMGSLWERLGAWDGPQSYERGAACLLIFGLAAVGMGMVASRRRAEERLRAGEQKYRKLLESAQEGVWLIDAHGDTLFVNPRMVQMLGVTVQQMVGRTLFDFMDAQDAAATRENIGKRKSGVSEVHNLELLHADGHRVFTRISTSPVLDEQGRYAGALAFVTDMTEERAAAAALHDSEERYAKAFQTSPDAVTITRLSDGRFLEVNEGFTRMTGYTLSEAVGGTGLSLGLYVHPEERARVLSTFAQEGAVKDLEVLFRRKDGSTFVATVTGTPLTFGSEHCILGTTRDITELKESADRIRASLKEKEILLREVHHRVKNNLQIVSTLLSLQKARAEDTGERKALSDTQSRVRSMALVHEKLYQAENLARVDFGEYVRELVAQIFRAYNPDPGRVRSLIEVRDAEFSADRAITCGLIVNELVTNSLKYAFPSERSGVVCVRLTRAEGWELTVQDDGVGLPAEFDYRTTGSLGMMLVDTLVQQLRGEIRLGAGPGTRITITFTTE